MADQLVTDPSVPSSTGKRRWRDLGGGAFAPEVVVAPVPGAAGLPVVQGAPVAANVLHGFRSFTATTAAATVLTVPAGRTWTGTASVSCAATTAAASSTAGQARAVVSAAGVGVTPAAGTLFALEARGASNAATGTVGNSASNSGSCPLVVVAPAGNDVQIQVAATVVTGVVDVTLAGALV